MFLSSRLAVVQYACSRKLKKKMKILWKLKNWKENREKEIKKKIRALSWFRAKRCLCSLESRMYLLLEKQKKTTNIRRNRNQFVSRAGSRSFRSSNYWKFTALPNKMLVDSLRVDRPAQDTFHVWHSREWLKKNFNYGHYAWSWRQKKFVARISQR